VRPALGGRGPGNSGRSFAWLSKGFQKGFELGWPRLREDNEFSYPVQLGFPQPPNSPIGILSNSSSGRSGP
jgi:hypothetical protein